MASIAERWTMWSGRFGARWANERISEMAYVSKEEGRDARKVLYSSRGPMGARGGIDH